MVCLEGKHALKTFSKNYFETFSLFFAEDSGDYTFMLGITRPLFLNLPDSQFIKL
jgi:hypothetical protein